MRREDVGMIFIETVVEGWGYYLACDSLQAFLASSRIGEFNVEPVVLLLKFINSVPYSIGLLV